MFTINIYLVIGFSLAIVYLLWQVNSLTKALKQIIVLNNYTMSALDDMLQQRDEEVDQKIEKLEAQMEYMNDKENSKTS